MLAGSTFAFNTHTLTRIAHVQALHLYALPLALLAVDRLLSEGRTRDAVWLAVWMTVMAYSSGYLFVFGAIAIAVVLVARANEWLPRFKPVGGRLALAALASGLLILPLWRPYHRAATQQGMVRSLENVAEYLGHAAGVSGRERHDPPRDLERGLLPRSGGQLFSGIRGDRARARGRLGSAIGIRGRTATRRDARGDRRHRGRAVARHADAGLRLDLPRLSTDAGPSRRGALRQPVPAGHVGARRARACGVVAERACPERA